MNRRLLTLAVALGLVLCACGGDRGPDFTIGFKRLALDLAYKDEKLPEYVAPNGVVVPPEVGFLAPSFVAPKVAPPPAIAVAPKCPEAEPGKRPLKPATVFVTKPPPVGTYTTHVKGYAEIGAANPVRINLPGRGVQEIRDVKQTNTEDPINGPSQVITYDLFVPTLDGGTTTTYRVTYSPATTIGTVTQNVPGLPKAASGQLELIRLQIKSAAHNLDFQPDPPVTIMAFRSGQGTSWNSAGTDRRSGTSMVVSGSVSRRVNVDVCGDIYDTYEVISNEHIVNLETGFRSDTDPQDPNVYRVATNLGGLFVQQHIHATTSVLGDGAAAPSVVTVNYDQTLDSVTPVPPA